MEKMKIKTMNAIAPEALHLLASDYRVGPEVENPDAILVRSSPVDVAAYPNLLAVARAGAGVNTITVAKATEMGICVFNTPGANANAVVELIFVMLGSWLRKLPASSAFCQTLAGLSDEEINRRVESGKAAFRGMELAGKTLGVIGLGQIGVRVANAAISRQMRVVAFDPYPALENIHALSPGVHLARSLKEVVQGIEILTIHVPYSPKTHGLVNEALLAQLPPGTILINYSRGQVVDEAAMLAALASSRLSAYLTDFPSQAILGHPRILVTPHLGASTEESEELCSVMAVQELKAYLEYGTVSHSVNFPTAESIPAANVRCRLLMINRDLPGMIGFASRTIGEHGINIASYLNESNGAIGYNIIDLEGPIAPAVVAEIEAHPDVIRTRLLHFGK